MEDTVYVPETVLEAGAYSWKAECVDGGGRVVDSSPARSFTILSDAFGQPWVAAEELLARIPPEHLRCLFPKAMLPEILETLEFTRKEPFQRLAASARVNLKLTPPTEPDYDKLQFSQSDDRPVDPYEGYPTAKAKPPEKQWHFTATTENSAAKWPIAAMMRVSDGGKLPDITVKESSGTVQVSARFGADAAEVRIGLTGQRPLLKATYAEKSKEAEVIHKP